MSISTPPGKGSESGAHPEPPTSPFSGAQAPALERVLESLNQMSEDQSLPRNIRRGAQAARDELVRPRAAVDVRVASTVVLLDELANDTNLPVHGRTVIWSIISQLESLQ